MPSLDACRLIAAIAPGEPANAVAARLREHGVPLAVDGVWAIGVDLTRKSILLVTFGSGFHAGAAVHGVHIGMSSRDYHNAFRERRMLIPGTAIGTGIVGSFLSCPSEGWEMIVECDVRRGVYAMTLARAGRFRENAPDRYATMIEQVERQRRDRERAIATAAERTAARQRAIAVAARLRTIGDLDEMLDYWADNARLGGGGFNLRRYAAWLRAGDVDRWHAVAISWNWDNGIAPLRWIAAQPRCTAATALTIFYLGEPEDQKQDSDAGRLLHAIRRRWAARASPTAISNSICRLTSHATPPSVTPQRYRARCGRRCPGDLSVPRN